MSVTVSIILPVYNAKAWLGRCLGAIKAQTFRDFEVIAVDDGSADGSGATLDGYASDFKLTVLHQGNRGASVARNAALGIASGKYVLMVDADDVLHPRALEMAVGTAEAGRADFVVFDYRHVTENEVEGVSSGWRTDDTAVPLQTVLGDPLEWFVRGKRLPGLWQFLFSRASIEGRRFIPGIMLEDNPFIYSYLAGAPRGVHLGRELYCYVKTDGSVMRRTSLSGRIRSIESVMRELEASVSRQQFRMLVREEYFAWIKGFWRRAYGRDPELASVRPEFESFLARLMKDRLIRPGDCPLKWFLRFWSVMVRHGRTARDPETGLAAAYDYVCAIGDDCGTAMYMRQHGLRQHSGPFDWAGHLPNLLPDYVSFVCNGFRGFLEKKSLDRIEVDPEVFLDPAHDYYRDRRTGLEIPHDFPAGRSLDESFAAVREKYDRRIVRFLRALAASGRVLLIHHLKTAKVPDETIANCLLRLRDALRHPGIDLLVIMNAPDVDDPVFRTVIPGAVTATASIFGGPVSDKVLGNRHVCRRIYSRVWLRWRMMRNVRRWIRRLCLACGILRCGIGNGKGPA